ncbi:hypothetical protein [Candidatus Leptofilum sp.]|uniref:hypothetical protein n=1 Tax=Candidatus Leptofilum sp. TaxID=3241576 RepID=UPI003B5BCAC4
MTIPPFDDNPASRRSEEDLLRSAQSILLARERERIRVLEEELAAYRESEGTIEELQEKIEQLEAKLLQVERAYEDQLLDLQTNISILNYKNFGRSESLLSRLSPVFGRLIGKRIEEDREEMAKAFSPIMGQAIRTQIRNSRQDMIDAIYPIIGASVQKSVAETFRELQRNIDRRLRQTSGDIWRQFTARIRGVSRSELALRDAIPFNVEQIFFIQRDSGLLLATYPTEDADLSSGMIGGMLTAIRQFARDSFGRGRADTDLDEIQYGDDRIIIQGGQYAYLAVVINGIEPAGFRGELQTFASELHLDYEEELRSYAGDPETLPPLASKLAELMEIAAGAPEKSKPLSRLQRWFIFILGLGGVLFLALSCFYLQFTVALLPVAFPSPTPTATATATNTPTITPSPTNTPVPTNTPIPTLTPSQTPTNTPTFTPTFTPTPTQTPTNTSAPTNTPTPTVTLTPSLTPTPISALMIGNVFTLSEPRLFAPRTGEVIEGTAVTIVAVYADWAKIEWIDRNGLQEGWVLLQWIDLRIPIPDYLITPTPTRGF